MDESKPKPLSPEQQMHATIMQQLLREAGPLHRASWDRLVQLRKVTEHDPALQQQIADQEHRSYAREFVRDHPVRPLAALSMIGASGLYSLKKRWGLQKGRSQPTGDQFMSGVQGALEGAGWVKPPEE